MTAADVVVGGATHKLGLVFEVATKAWRPALLLTNDVPQRGPCG